MYSPRYSPSYASVSNMHLSQISIQKFTQILGQIVIWIGIDMFTQVSTHIFNQLCICPTYASLADMNPDIHPNIHPDIHLNRNLHIHPCIPPNIHQVLRMSQICISRRGWGFSPTDAIASCAWYYRAQETLASNGWFACVREKIKIL